LQRAAAEIIPTSPGGKWVSIDKKSCSPSRLVKLRVNVLSLAAAGNTVPALNAGLNAAGTTQPPTSNDDATLLSGVEGLLHGVIAAVVENSPQL
jgi:hypothetical protein